MTIRNRKPKDRLGFRYEYHEGCECLSCPWGNNCIGRTWPHWKEKNIMNEYERLHLPACDKPGCRARKALDGGCLECGRMWFEDNEPGRLVATQSVPHE